MNIHIKTKIGQNTSDKQRLDVSVLLLRHLNEKLELEKLKTLKYADLLEKYCEKCSCGTWCDEDEDTTCDICYNIICSYCVTNYCPECENQFCFSCIRKIVECHNCSKSICINCIESYQEEYQCNNKVFCLDCIIKLKIKDIEED